uniref:Uncharacterized protein n=1 Tax=Arion vulgaris TaxID=1028688 RepID=A0A0B6ZNY0_9EUPU
MEYLTYCRVGRMMLFSMSIAIIVCMLFHLGRAADERESESSFDNDNVNEIPSPV